MHDIKNYDTEKAPKRGAVIGNVKTSNLLPESVYFISGGIVLRVWGIAKESPG